MNTETVFLVRLGMSSFPARHEVHRKTIRNFVPSCVNELLPTLTKYTASGLCFEPLLRFSFVYKNKWQCLTPLQFIIKVNQTNKFHKKKHYGPITNFCNFFLQSFQIYIHLMENLVSNLLKYVLLPRNVFPLSIFVILNVEKKTSHLFLSKCQYQSLSKSLALLI